MTEKKTVKKTGKELKTSSPKKKHAKRRTSKKGRVKLDRQKVNLLCGIVFLCCSLCLAFAILFSSPNTKKNTVSVSKALPEKVASSQKIENTQAGQKKITITESPDAKKTAKNQEKKSSSSKIAKKPDVTTAKKAEVKTAEKPKPEVKSKANNAVNETAANKKKNPFAIPPAKNGAVICLIMDDAGMSVENTKKYVELPFPLTVAVLPKLKNSKACAEAVRNGNKELILHQPMQSLNHSLDPGPGKITVDMSFSEIYSIVSENLMEIGPGVRGINNHEGSEVTEDVLRIGAVLDVCIDKGIYFLDSRTSAYSKAPQAALERDIKIFEKAGPYIDNVVSREAMLAQLYKTLDFANSHGKAIIIAHVDKSVKILPALLLQMYPYLQEAGYRFSTLSSL